MLVVVGNSYKVKINRKLMTGETQAVKHCVSNMYLIFISQKNGQSLVAEGILKNSSISLLQLFTIFLFTKYS